MKCQISSTEQSLSIKVLIGRQFNSTLLVALNFQNEMLKNLYKEFAIFHTKCVFWKHKASFLFFLINSFGKMSKPKKIIYIHKSVWIIIWDGLQWHKQLMNIKWLQIIDLSYYKILEINSVVTKIHYHTKILFSVSITFKKAFYI